MNASDVYVVLDNVRSAHNVGAIFRTADGVGVSKVFLVGITPQPVDRFGRVRREIEKTSLGAVSTIAWEYCVDAKTCVDRLREIGTHIIVVEQGSTSVPYYHARNNTPVAYVFGNEIDGVSDGFLSNADTIVQIPMSGEKESLNVATVAGIILFHHRDGNISR